MDRFILQENTVYITDDSRGLDDFDMPSSDYSGYIHTKHPYRMNASVLFFTKYTYKENQPIYLNDGRYLGTITNSDNVYMVDEDDAPIFCCELNLEYNNLEILTGGLVDFGYVWNNRGLYRLKDCPNVFILHSRNYWKIDVNDGDVVSWTTCDCNTWKQFMYEVVECQKNVNLFE